MAGVGRDSALELELDRQLAHGRVAAHLFGATGDKLKLGRFEVLRLLGRGAMGSVYEAFDSENEAHVALKVLRHVDARGVYRLKREFRSLAGTSHPSLISLGELFCEQGVWFFSMELVEHAVPLDAWVRPEPDRFDEARLRDAFLQLARAIAALHATGKLHCDLKPHNVVVAPQGRVVVLDFGLVSEVAIESDRGVPHSGWAGTPAYIAPEQAEGEAPTEASDWYSFGVMLFEALTGTLPFDGDPIALLRTKLRSEPPTVRLSSPWNARMAELCTLCDRLLARDSKRRPCAADVLQAFERDALPVRHGPSPSEPPPPSFVGREVELGAMRCALSARRVGAPVALLIRGRSGAGKSALLDRFVVELGGDMLVLRGRCHEHESVPYKAFDSVVDALCEHLRSLPHDQALRLVPRNAHALLQLFPTLGRVRAMAEANAPRPPVSHDAREARRRALAALKELLLRVSDRTPLAIVVDDLQWGDADSAPLIDHLLGAPDPVPLLFLGAFRSEEVEASTFLQSLLASGTTGERTVPHVLDLGPLSAEDSVVLARALLQSECATADEQMARTLAAEAQGLPFLIGELVRHTAAMRRSISSAERRAVSLEQAIVERISTLPARARDLLQVISVAGGPIECPYALTAAGLSYADRPLLIALRRVYLVRSQGSPRNEALEIYHDRIREIIIAQLDGETKRSIHARIAAAMVNAGVVASERLVAHYVGADERLRAGEAAVHAAASAAGKLAFGRAAELYQQAIDLLAHDLVAQRNLHERLGHALSNAGRGAQAAEAYLTAARHRTGAAARTLERLAVQQYLRGGRSDQAYALAARVFRDVGLSFPVSQAQAYAQYAVAHLTSMPRAPQSGPSSDALRERLQTLHMTFREVGMLDPLRGAALQMQMVRHAKSLGDTERLLHGLAWQAWRSALTRKDARVALDLLVHVDALAKQHPTPYAVATAKSARAGCALFLRRMCDVIEPAAEAERILREQCEGTLWEQSVVAAYRYAAIEQVGGFRAVLDEAPLRAREAVDRDDRFAEGVLTLFVTFASLANDQSMEVLRFLDDRQSTHSEHYTTFQLWAAIRRGHALLYRGDAAEARDWVALEYKRFSASPISRTLFYRTTMRSLIARCELSHDCSPRAIKQAESLARAMCRTGHPHSHALALLLLGQAAYRRGNDDDAVARLRDCVARAHSLHAPMLGVYAGRALGCLIGGDEGRALVRDADERLTREGVRDPQSWTRVWLDLGT